MPTTPMGNRTSETKRGVAKAFTYDGADRLISAGGVTYAYDANGQPDVRNKAGGGEGVHVRWGGSADLGRGRDVCLRRQWATGRPKQSGGWRRRSRTMGRIG